MTERRVSGVDVILRFFRSQVVAADEEQLVRIVRDEAIPEALAIPGLVSFQPALRRTSSGLELLVVSTWSGFDDLLATGRPLDAPIAIPRANGMLLAGGAEHFELVGSEARGIPVAGRTLELRRVRIVPDGGAHYFELGRRLASGLLDESRVAAFHLGRRVAGTVDEAVAVSLWTGGPRLDEPALAMSMAELEDGAAAVEEWEAITVADPSPTAPAILLADDERRYLYATPAAAELTGIPVARLQAMRVDDLAAPGLREGVPAMWGEFIANGSLDGPFSLQRPDGTVLDVHFSARARAPWPGCHASLLVPADHEPIDIRRGLVAAGFLSRYESAPPPAG